PLIIGTSVVAFAVAILAIVGFESATGTQIGGGTGSSIGKIFGGGGGKTDPTPSKTPTTSSDDTQWSTNGQTSPIEDVTLPATHGRSGAAEAVERTRSSPGADRPGFVGVGQHGPVQK